MTDTTLFPGYSELSKLGHLKLRRPSPHPDGALHTNGVVGTGVVGCIVVSAGMEGAVVVSAGVEGASVVNAGVVCTPVVSPGVVSALEVGGGVVGGAVVGMDVVVVVVVVLRLMVMPSSKGCHPSGIGYSLIGSNSGIQFSASGYKLGGCSGTFGTSGSFGNLDWTGFFGSGQIAGQPCACSGFESIGGSTSKIGHCG